MQCCTARRVELASRSDRQLVETTPVPRLDTDRPSSRLGQLRIGFASRGVAVPRRLAGPHNHSIYPALPRVLEYIRKVTIVGDDDEPPTPSTLDPIDDGLNDQPINRLPPPLRLDDLYPHSLGRTPSDHTIDLRPSLLVENFRERPRVAGDQNVGVHVGSRCAAHKGGQHGLDGASKVSFFGRANVVEVPADERVERVSVSARPAIESTTASRRRPGPLAPPAPNAPTTDC